MPKCWCGRLFVPDADMVISVSVSVCGHDKHINKTCLSRACQASIAAGLNPVKRIIFAPFHLQRQTTAHILHVWLSAYFNYLLCVWLSPSIFELTSNPTFFPVHFLNSLTTKLLVDVHKHLIDFWHKHRQNVPCHFSRTGGSLLTLHYPHTLGNCHVRMTHLIWRQN